MSKRYPLRNIIIEAWQDCIDNDYMKQRINSERSLQASFWSQLNGKLPPTKRIFIEPPMTIKAKNDIKKIIPDIVICNTKEVISVIELKYLPRGQPKFDKDFESLALISKKRKLISIKNSRFRGIEEDSKEYTLSKDILFVWASIHAQPRHETETPNSCRYKSLENNFFQLHAETKQGAKPVIYIVE
tara:strand:- start:135 stop:695 length:561 start_codon:yes stop_codon:yes gene_type:complete